MNAITKTKIQKISSILGQSGCIQIPKLFLLRNDMASILHDNLILLGVFRYKL
jgi:hypothetical protein